MQTLFQVIKALEGIARQEPGVAMVVPGDVFRLNAIPDAKYGVFAWTQGQHREDSVRGILTVALTLFYVDRLTADKHNELEVQSVGVSILGDIFRRVSDIGIYVNGEIRYTTFTERFLDECAGAFAGVDLDVPLDWICPDDYVVPEPEPPVVVEKYVQDLLDEGWAVKVTGDHGDYIEILPTCPYTMEQVLDLEEVTLNEKQLVEERNNVIVWDRELPAGWTPEAIAAIYTGKDLNFTPRGALLWAMSGLDSFTISFTGGSWIAADYPWGSYHSEGIFAPRWNESREAEYAALGFRNTPKNVVVNLANFSSIGQVMFTMMKTTEELTINVIEGQYFGCHDVVGMFEGDIALQTLNIYGDFIWESIRTCLNMFDGCQAMESIPYNTRFGRSHPYNELFPRFDGTRGSANVRRIFNACHKLKTIGPIFNMSAISRNGCTYGGYQQDPTGETLFDCPELEDVQIKGLGNSSWNFTDHSTGTYIPKISAASIDYLLQNVQSVSGLTLTLPALHQAEVTSGFIELARGRGWTVNFV